MQSSKMARPSRAWLAVGLVLFSFAVPSVAKAKAIHIPPPGTPDQNLAAFREAFDEAAENDQSTPNVVDTIFIPAGHYYFNAGLTDLVPHNLRILGAGQAETILEPARKSQADGDGFGSRLLFKFNNLSGLLEIADLTIQVTDPSPMDPQFEGYLWPWVKDANGSYLPNTTALHNMIGIVGRSGPYDVDVHDVTLKGAAGDGTKRDPSDPIEGGLGGKNATYLLVNYKGNFPGTDTFENDTFANAADTCLEGAWAFLDTHLTVEDSNFTGCFMGITAPYDNESPEHFINVDFEGTPDPICVRGDINCYQPYSTYGLVQKYAGVLFDYSRNVVEKHITVDGVEQPDVYIDNSPPVAVASATVGPDDGDGFATVTLDGSASYSPYFEDEVVAWKWTDESGAVLSTDPVADVQLSAGEHSIELTVYDKRTATLYYPPGTVVYENDLPGTDTITVDVP